MAAQRRAILRWGAKRKKYKTMKKPFDYVFIDTCVFMRESYFKKSGAVARLFVLAEQGWIKILMPEIAR